MKITAALMLVAALPTATGPGVAQSSTASAPAPYIDPTTFDPALLLPPPPAPGSAEEQRELREVRAIMAAASPAEHAQTRADDADEDPGVFDQAVAPGFSLRRLPRTWALLTRVAVEADGVASLAKRHFDRTRPWGVDPGIVPCDAGPGKKPAYSYPSGHAVMGHTVGLVLAQLLPEKAPAILARAHRYAVERIVCGAHYPSDIDASHALAAIIAARLGAVPAFQADAAAAAAELRTALSRR